MASDKRRYTLTQTQTKTERELLYAPACHERCGFTRSTLSGLQSLCGLPSEFKPGLEILESSWQNMQSDYNGGELLRSTKYIGQDKARGRIAQ